MPFRTVAAISEMRLPAARATRKIDFFSKLNFDAEEELYFSEDKRSRTFCKSQSGILIALGGFSRKRLFLRALNSQELQSKSYTALRVEATEAL